MDEDEIDERPPFRWNWQAMVMLALTGTALVLPLVCVAWVASGYFVFRQPPATTQVDTASLEQGLERMAEARFAEEVTLDGKDGLELRVAPEDMAARAKRVLEIAREAGGSGLDLSAPDAPARRIVIQAPASRHELLKGAIRGEPVNFSAIPAGTATRLLEVELRAP